MIWLFVVASALASFVIAAVTVGGVTARLAVQPRRSTYDIEEAVAFVGDALAPEITAEITYDDVRATLLAHVDYLQQRGLASYSTAEEMDDGLILVTDEEPVAFVIGALAETETDISDERVVAILDAEQLYYARIGAIGPIVDGPA